MWRVPNDNDTPGARIKERRQEIPKYARGQAALAEDVGVARGTVSAWENDRFEPEGENLRRLAELLGVTVGWILDGGVPPARELGRRPDSAGMSAGFLRLRIEGGASPADAWADADRFALQAEMDRAGLAWWMAYRQGVIDTGIYSPAPEVEADLRKAAGWDGEEGATGQSA